MITRDKYGRFLKGHHWRKPQPFRDKEWLMDNYITKQRSTGDIAREFGVTDDAICFWLRKYGIRRRSIQEARQIKYWGLSGASNPMWNRRGELNGRWLGGVTADRQAFYTSSAWREACSLVWKRDNATCRMCGAYRCDFPDRKFHIHHVVSFSNIALRAEPSNLVLLCEFCHRFVHSKRNKDHEFIS